MSNEQKLSRQRAQAYEKKNYGNLFNTKTQQTTSVFLCVPDVKELF